MAARSNRLLKLALVTFIVTAYDQETQPEGSLEQVSDFELGLDGQFVRRLIINEDELSKVIWSGILQFKLGEDDSYELREVDVVVAKLQKTGFIRLHDPNTPMSQPKGRIVAELDKASYSIKTNGISRIIIDGLYFINDDDQELTFYSLYLNNIDPSEASVLADALTTAGASAADPMIQNDMGTASTIWLTTPITPSGGARQLWHGAVQLRVLKPEWSQIARMVSVNSYAPHLSAKTGVTGLIRWTRPEGAVTGTVKQRELLILNSSPAQFSQDPKVETNKNGFESIQVIVENVYDVSEQKFVTLQMKHIGFGESADLFNALIAAGADNPIMEKYGGTLLWQSWVERKFGEDGKESGGPDRFLQIIKFSDEESESSNRMGVLRWKRPDAARTSEPLWNVRNMYVIESNQATLTKGFDSGHRIDNIWDEPTAKYRTVYLKMSASGPKPFEDMMWALGVVGVMDVSATKDVITIKDGEWFGMNENEKKNH